MAKTDPRRKAVEAFLALLAEQSYAEITLPAIAERAGLRPSELRAEFDGKRALLEAFARDIDRTVLDGIDPQMAGEPARERLFDTLMRRFDALGPHKEAVRALDRAVRADPGLALAWFPVAVRSQRWMLAAAGIDTSGMRGEIAARGAVLAFARALRVWLDDEDPGLARTLAALDGELRRAERGMRMLDDVARVVNPLCGIARRVAEMGACAVRGRDRRRSAPEPGEAARS